MGFDDASYNNEPPDKAEYLVWEVKQKVLAWLGTWRDKMPPQAVTALQNVLDVPNEQ